MDLLWPLLFLLVSAQSQTLFDDRLNQPAQEGSVRLMGGQASAGRVEICHDGRWGSVCDDGWDLTDAQVVCRQMGFSGAITATSGGRFQAGCGQIWMKNVKCDGSESSLSECIFSGWGVSDCKHEKDAGVVCEVDLKNMDQVDPQKPTLSLVPVTTQKSTFVMCVIEDFYPKHLTVQWKENDINISILSKLEYEQNAEGLYTAYSLYKVSSETWDTNTCYTCEVTHQQKTISLTKNFNAKFSLELKPPIERELFVNDRVVLEAVVSGDAEAVKVASVSCKVKNEPVISVTGTVQFSLAISQFIKITNIIVDANKWFDGEMVTCTVHDTNNNRDIKQEIFFDKGDGQRPSVVIYTPQNINTEPVVSWLCEVTSSKLGNVYIMWKVGDEPYIKGSTSAPIHQNDSTSVLSKLTMTKQQYYRYSPITCAVIHANIY